MKNISKKFLIIFITFSIMISINLISKATNELMRDSSDLDAISNEAQDIYEDYEENSTNSGREKNYFSISSNDVTVSKDVVGDVFICTSGTATIDASISGNVFICATNIKISKDAEIYSSLFGASENLNILGSIGGNVYSASKNFTLAETAYVDLDLFLTAQNSDIKGSIYGDAYISGEKIAISENAYIEGNLNYSSEKEINIPEDVVDGKINFSKSSYEQDNSKNTINEWIYSAFSYIIFVVVLFIICKWINCKFVNAHTNFISNLPKYLLYGLLGLIVIPIICVILLVLQITASLSFILLAIYCIFMLIASASIVIVLSNLCAEKLKDKLKMNDTLRAIICIIVFCIVYKLLQLIPTIGFILTLAFAIVGFGLLMKSTFPTK